MSKSKIMLGDQVQDIISGHIGIAVARTQFLNGCVQYAVAGKIKKGESFPISGDPSIDQDCLKVIKRRAVESKEYLDAEPIEKETGKKTNGGPTKFMRGMRGY